MKRHDFTPQGIEKFEKAALWNIFEALDNGEGMPEFIISIGSEAIEIPLHADVFADLIRFLEHSEADSLEGGFKRMGDK